MTTTNPIDLDLTAPVSASADAEISDIPPQMSQESVRAFETALGERPSVEARSLQETFGAAVKSVAEGFSLETLKAVVDETLSLELPKPLMVVDGTLSLERSKSPMSMDETLSLGMPKPPMAVDETLSSGMPKSPMVVDETLPVGMPKLPMVVDDRNSDTDQTVIAVPVVVPQQIEVAVRPVEPAASSDRASAVEAVSRVEQAVSAAETMVRAAEAVADAILVSPGLKAGDGEMLIRLRPDVLDGSAVRIAVSGRQLEVEFMPMQMETAALIERNMSQLQQHLVARVHMYTVGVSVKKDRNGRI